MSCTIDETTVGKVIDFHGHSCPGLAIGIRAAEAGLHALGHAVDAPPTSLVAVVETDMCGVDAIQYLTGCTLGKGNLIHRDYGKMAFSFHDRETGRGVRLLLNPEVRGDKNGRMATLMRAVSDGSAGAAEKQELTDLRQSMQELFMTVESADMFRIQELDGPPPRGPVILDSLVCETCGESTMESRTRRMQGKTLCIPCFNKVEQKS